MYIHGEFINKKNDTISVHIVTMNDKSTEMEIGAEDGNLFFSADDAVEIENEVNDTFDHLLCHQATVRLLTAGFISDFFCSSARESVVNIYKNGICVFAGFIEPQVFSQDYNNLYDELELNCIDVLSALQYSKYKEIGKLGVSYAGVKCSANQVTFHDLVVDMLKSVSDGIGILGQSTKLYYDGSKAIDSDTSHRYNILSCLSISELLFLGDEEDDVWQQDKILSEILKYLNLHITQEGFNFYLFSWESIKSTANKEWKDIITAELLTTETRGTQITVDKVEGMGTQISVGEIFNKLIVKCDVKSTESVIESPLDDDNIVPAFVNKQQYLTEYSSDGEGISSLHAFYNLVHGATTDYAECDITTWLIQVMKNSNWIVGTKGVDLVNTYCSDGKNQQMLLNKLRNMPAAAILSIGSVTQKGNKQDNSPITSLDMSNYFVISVNGNGIDNDETKTVPSESSLKDNMPVAVYTSNTSGGVFSPSDRDTTNYIVISGKILLNPIMPVSGYYSDLRKRTDWYNPSASTESIPTVNSRNNTDGRYYAQQFWKAETPNATPVWDETTNESFVPFTDTGDKEYEFKYSAIGDSTDKINKVGVIACMLIIGDKCVVETGSGGTPEDFEWKNYKERTACANDDEYYQQCFTIGFDPAIGDKLIGTEFSMQKTLSYNRGVDAEGIAIPIRMSDKVSGKVQFMILGPVNVTWGDVTRRHPSFWRHTKWGENQISLMAHVSSVMLNSFEIKVYSDNGLVSAAANKDLIYMSDTREKYVNVKDDIEFKISSDLTLSECKAYGVNAGVKLSTPLNIISGIGVLNIYDTNKGVQVKAEQNYVDSYYTEYSTPHIILTQTLQDMNNNVSIFDHYTHPALGKTFFVQGISRNLMEGSAELVLKEI